MCQSNVLTTIWNMSSNILNLCCSILLLLWNLCCWSPRGSSTAQLPCVRRPGVTSLSGVPKPGGGGGTLYTRGSWSWSITKKIRRLLVVSGAGWDRTGKTFKSLKMICLKFWYSGNLLKLFAFVNNIHDWTPN